jgi:CARDB
MKIFLSLILGLIFIQANLFAANLTAVGISVADINGSARSTFSDTESITLRQQVNNSTDATPSMISFTFYILNPSGVAEWSLSGNAAPGTPGISQTQVSGLAISKFYSVPGSYIFKGKAVLDGETVEQEISFNVSSPNITLIYPPYGAKNLSDNPLVFRWVGSGASKYKLAVSDNAGLYNPVYTYVNTGENSATYPQNPTQPREQLVSGQVYYWKIEGLDTYNNKISESNVYSFAMQADAASQSRNITVSALTVKTPTVDFQKPINFSVTVANTGSTNESNIALKFSLGGLPAQDSPKQIAFLNAGQSSNYEFTAFVPSGQDDSLAVACTDLFDDNIPDNCKTKLISKSGGSGFQPPVKKLSYTEMWNAILARLGPEAMKSMEGYTFESISCPNCTGMELSEMIAALIGGDASIINAAIASTGSLLPSSSGSSTSSGLSALANAPELSLDIADFSKTLAKEWSGFSNIFNNKKTKTFVLRTKKEWKKVWKLLSPEELPSVNFKKKIVVGIIAGAKDRAETIRILNWRKTAQGGSADYYMVQAAKTKKMLLPAYIFKVLDKNEGGKVEFKRLDINK